MQSFDTSLLHQCESPSQQLILEFSADSFLSCFYELNYLSETGFLKNYSLWWCEREAERHTCTPEIFSA